MSIEKLLNEEIQGEFEKLKGMELGTEEYKKTVDGLTLLTGKAIELENHKSDKKDRLIKNCITAGGTILTLGLTIWGTVVSLNFEKTGSVTTIVGRGFINKLLPKK